MSKIESSHGTSEGQNNKYWGYILLGLLIGVGLLHWKFNTKKQKEDIKKEDIKKEQITRPNGIESSFIIVTHAFTCFGSGFLFINLALDPFNEFIKYISWVAAVVFIAVALFLIISTLLGYCYPKVKNAAKNFDSRFLTQIFYQLAIFATATRFLQIVQNDPKSPIVSIASILFSIFLILAMIVLVLSIFFALKQLSLNFHEFILIIIGSLSFLIGIYLTPYHLLFISIGLLVIGVILLLLGIWLHKKTKVSK